jgi:hypothetical protein
MAEVDFFLNIWIIFVYRINTFFKYDFCLRNRYSKKEVSYKVRLINLIINYLYLIIIITYQLYYIILHYK